MARILVIDDSLQTTRALARLLGHLGYDVTVAESGEQALVALESIIPDLMMPGIDGNEVLRQIRENPATKAVPVVIYTAVADEAMRIHTLERGAQDYWVKAAFDINEIKTRLNDLLAA